ncbi:hypothetical protein ACOMHN_051091 [Nucella lapillus]
MTKWVHCPPQELVGIRLQQIGQRSTSWAPDAGSISEVQPTHVFLSGDGVRCLDTVHLVCCTGRWLYF